MSDPGYFLTFESKAEARIFIRNKEICDLIYKLIKDCSFDVETTLQTDPYFMPFEAIDGATNNCLTRCLFSLGKIDLLQLKQ